MKKFTNQAGGSAGFHKTLFFSSKNGEKNYQKKIRLHKTPTGRAGQPFLTFFFVKFCFFQSDGSPLVVAVAVAVAVAVSSLSSFSSPIVGAYLRSFSGHF